MTLTTEYNIHQSVTINALDINALVTEIKLASKDPKDYMYNLEYWWEGQIRSVWLYEWEISPWRVKT